jgi:hypothetical protein
MWCGRPLCQGPLVIWRGAAVPAAGMTKIWQHGLGQLADDIVAIHPAMRAASAARPRWRRRGRHQAEPGRRRGVDALLEGEDGASRGTRRSSRKGVGDSRMTCSAPSLDRELQPRRPCGSG